MGRLSHPPDAAADFPAAADSTLSDLFWPSFLAAPPAPL